jgi:lipoic acid synthetase/lipoate-protein ligase A
MKYLLLPETKDRSLAFYLAMEEYVARQMDESDCFFMWQVKPSVIFGRNQVVENEVNVDYCRANGISMYRRKSGGGCVYADMDNLMLSYVSADGNVNFAFHKFINMVLLVLRKMGVEATGTSHNDVLIGGSKVCGTACYHVCGKSIVHSTMLYDTNMQHMTHAITPSQEKLQKKGIESVRQRITLLKDHTTMSLDEIKTLIRNTLCTDERLLTASEVADIEQLEQSYLEQEFIKILQ